MNNPLKKEDGFTLLELLVALSLMSFLSLLLYASTNFAIHAWSVSQNALINSTQLRNTMAHLRSELAQAYPKSSDAENKASIEFYGGTDRISFMTPSETHPAEFTKSQVRLEDDHDGKVLIEESHRELGFKAEKSLLLRNVKAFKITYFGDAESSPTLSWHPTWNGRNKLPRLIRFEISFFDRSRGQESVFTVQPRLTSDITCVFDAISKSCRGQ